MHTRRNPGTHGSYKSETPEIDVLTLSCGEIAVALHVAGLPTLWRKLPTQSLIDLASKGLAKIGLDEVIRIDVESHAIVTAIMKARRTPGSPESFVARNQLRAVWTSKKSMQNAVAAAWTIIHPADQRIANSGH